MDGLLLALALVCAVVNALGILGGREAVLRARVDDRETRATGWYLIARCVAIAVAALIGAAGLLFSWPGEVAGWIFAVAAITVLVQLLDVPVWLSRPSRWGAAAAGGLAVLVAVLGMLALVRL